MRYNQNVFSILKHSRLHCVWVTHDLNDQINFGHRDEFQKILCNKSALISRCSILMQKVFWFVSTDHCLQITPQKESKAVSWRPIKDELLRSFDFANLFNNKSIVKLTVWHHFSFHGILITNIIPHRSLFAENPSLIPFWKVWCGDATMP